MTVSKTPTSDFGTDLEKLASFDSQARMAALAVLAHDLTVDIRATLPDLPSPEAIDRLRTLNEFLHQITGRISASNEHTGRSECDLLQDIVEDARRKGLKSVVVRRLGAAVRHASTYPRKRAAITA